MDTKKDKFAVLFTAQECEIFGVFDSFKEAKEWMEKDFLEIITQLKECYVENRTDTTCSIDGFGEWQVLPITQVKK